MSPNKDSNDEIVLSYAPGISGLSFRRFRGERDYPVMVAVINGSNKADGIAHTDSLEDVTAAYRHLVNCDPYKDVLFVKMKDEVVGYARVWWILKSDGTRTYCHFALLLPEWRGKGIRRAMLRHNEDRLREIAKDHPKDDPRLFETWAADTETDWESLLIAHRYEAVRYLFEMVRPNLDDIPDMPMPEGLEVRPAQPEHYRKIWDAAGEAFQDHWGATEWRDEWFEQWQEKPIFNPKLWQVAWDGYEVAGMVLNFIHQEENKEFNRKRGYTEEIGVRRPWRKRGLARALIARSFKVLKDQGMTEAALSVDAENITGALGLYESMGFRTVKRHTTFRKPMD
ncbi:MAG: GNAT family N-acetyltransferase [candidate division Zixibacteria bacterium]|nr:GNAT family N-acetyltransferase [candidate division Zixibacteria bacterium]